MYLRGGYTVGVFLFIGVFFSGVVPPGRHVPPGDNSRLFFFACDMPNRISLAELEQYIAHIASTVPLDANVHDMSPEDRFIVETGLHVAAHTHVARWGVHDEVSDVCARLRVSPLYVSRTVLPDRTHVEL